MIRDSKTSDNPRQGVEDPPWVRRTLIGITYGFIFFLLVIPLFTVFHEAFASGWRGYFQALANAEILEAAWLSFIIALATLPLNLGFGFAAAWVVTRFHFRGKPLLLTLIDLPFAVSPVVVGLIFVLVFGRFTPIGNALHEVGIQVIFSWLGILLVTLFVTFPIAARELIPLMEEIGSQEEEAARTLGASFLQMLRYVTLPNLRWGLLYAAVLTFSRALGEFGAVSIVSGHIRGSTVTLPLEIEILYNEYGFVASFAAATLLAYLALVTLAIKIIIESRRS